LKDGVSLFIAKDVCDVLGLGNITEELRELDDDERSKFRNPEVTPKGGESLLDGD
jgi:prophage antirepressor-like protein